MGTSYLITSLVSKDTKKMKIFFCVFAIVSQSFSMSTNRNSCPSLDVVFNSLLENFDLLDENLLLTLKESLGDKKIKRAVRKCLKNRDNCPSVHDVIEFIEATFDVEVPSDVHDCLVSGENCQSIAEVREVLESFLGIQIPDEYVETVETCGQNWINELFNEGGLEKNCKVPPEGTEKPLRSG